MNRRLSRPEACGVATVRDPSRVYTWPLSRAFSCKEMPRHHPDTIETELYGNLSTTTCRTCTTMERTKGIRSNAPSDVKTLSGDDCLPRGPRLSARQSWDLREQRPCMLHERDNHLRLVKGTRLLVGLAASSIRARSEGFHFTSKSAEAITLGKAHTSFLRPRGSYVCLSGSGRRGRDAYTESSR